ncbi:hypothetical protein ASE70_08090 [Sphingomonas sp. Leaf22]|uniref:hypothetical protein n=1 Tax=Sphingomonas sp. Leaf22 TaxID=1735687 RepID=UPI0006F5A725|nr:hypothetical protein [Sphingomonas sp. Leaf22]KQM76722.1 hypothetical protein ASE70_08090 [Sphingomonas sp. Leaf22]
MTTACEPLSIEQTLRDVVEALSIERAVEITGRSPQYLRALSHPEKREQLTCRDAVLLDAAHDSIVGGRPIHDMMALMIDDSGSGTLSCERQLMDATIDAFRESSEAHAALLEASLPNASPAKRRKAMRELLQAFSAKRRIMPILQKMMQPPGQSP